MSEDATVDDARRSLTAVLALIDSCPASDQVPMLRSLVEQGLDQLEDLEQDANGFLAECVLLAASNLQDVRLNDLESRLDALEHPPPPLPADLLVETAIVLAFELAVMGLVPVGVDAIDHVFTRVRRVRRRRAVLAAEQSLDSASGVLAQSSKALRAAEAMYQRLAREYASVSARRRTPEVTSRLIEVVQDVVRQSVHITLVKRAHHASEKQLGQAIAAAEQAWENASAVSDKWTGFLDGALAATAHGRVAQNTGVAAFAAMQQRGGEGAAAASPLAFISSLVVGAMLDTLRAQRIASAEEYATHRHYLKTLDDADLLDDSLAQQVAGATVELVPQQRILQVLSPAARASVVAGLEVMLWRDYLAVNGVLTDPVRATVRLRHRLESPQGRIVDGVLVTAEEPRVEVEAFGNSKVRRRFYSYDGTAYPGLPHLTDVQTAYLFPRFALPYFERGLSTLPFDFEPSAYTGVWQRPTQFYGGFMVNTVRSRRIDEMRLMVVLFFVQFAAGLDGSSTTFGVTVDQVYPLSDWLDWSPRSQQRWDESLVDPLEALQAAGGAEGPAAALLTDLGIGVDPDTVARLNRVRDLVVDLDLQLFIATTLGAESFEPADLPQGPTRAEVLETIGRQRALLDVEYPALIESLAADPEQQQAVRDELEARVRRITGWEPGEQLPDARRRATPQWRWYDPAPSGR